MAIAPLSAPESVALAFRGYNVTNLGRTPELLAHAAYGPPLARRLSAASGWCSDHLRRPVDLVARVREGLESTLETFAEDLALITSVSLAHLELLAEFHGFAYRQARLSLGYSLGEVTALVASGVYELDSVLRPLLGFADDAAELARDVTMGVVFSRGPALDVPALERLCLELTQQGAGTIAVSSQLSPNTVLVLAQGELLDRFKAELPKRFDPPPHMRKSSGHWPPLHTAILWQKQIRDRAALAMQSMPGGFVAPAIPLVSLVTGKQSYNDHNSRDLLRRWIDEPQRLWDALCEVLASGVDQVLHLGPDPNLIPATLRRLSDNVAAQMNAPTWEALGLRAVSRLARRGWLTKVLSTRAVLLRVPFLSNVIVEDWLLEHPVR